MTKGGGGWGRLNALCKVDQVFESVRMKFFVTNKEYCTAELATVTVYK